MSGPSSETNPDLESFREQWRAEVRNRRPAPATPSSTTVGPSSSTGAVAGPSSARPANPTGAPKKPPPPPTKQVATQDDDDDGIQPLSFDEPSRGGAGVVMGEQRAEPEEPVSALDHYEQAVERETAGKLGDSLRLYRKAFRMDDSVDQKYKAKHFPKPPPKPATTKTPTTPAPDPPAAAPQSMTDLITSFSHLSIPPAPPPVEGMPPPPCPIAALPDEILMHILLSLALLDPAAFTRLSLVCRRLAHLVATEDRIWRRLSLGPEFGLGAMHTAFQRTVTWSPLLSPLPSPPIPPPTVAPPTSWQTAFRTLLPRLRFAGVYISTVNYMRPGAHDTSTTTAGWGANPVHIVTYYRYLRFFRDGTAVSLLTTHEPSDVAGHLTRDSPNAKSGPTKGALRGRWKLDLDSGFDGDLVVETEGVSQYIYRMDLALRSGGGGRARGTRVVWRGFYSYSRLTDDWAEFVQKNAKPFYYSRVRSFGVMGE
ncbi:F-box protein pof7 [Podospora conica]|nr:F-box protein pof7 [Schizothecium conicum]